MRAFAPVALFLAAASAAPVDGPSGHEVEIAGLSFAGSGCSAGSVASLLSDDLTAITLLYDSFIALAGSGSSAADKRKNCQVAVKLHYPSGWQFTVLRVDYRGYAGLQKGDSGTCKATYYFSGEREQVSSTLTIPGPYNDNYFKVDMLDIESNVWSPCGQEGMLNINSEVRISPIGTTHDAIMTVGLVFLPWSQNIIIRVLTPLFLEVDPQDMKFTQISYIQWQRCTR